MSYPDLMPVSGYSFTPPVVQQQDRSNHHLLGSALLGGAAAYGAYKLNLDIIKDSMSAEAFEDAVRSGRKFDTRTWTPSERSLLAQAKKDVALTIDPEISRIFGTKDSVNMYEYLRERHHGQNIRTAQELEKAIAGKERTTGNENSSHHSELEKQDRRRPHIQELKNHSDELSRVESQISEYNQKQTKLQEALSWNKVQEPKAGSEEAKKLASEIQSQEKELSQIRKKLGEFNSKRSRIAGDMEKIMKSANITNDSIRELSGGAYTKLDELKSDLRVGLTDSKAGDATGRRKAFFESYYDSALTKHEELLKIRPEVDETVAGMKADLELVREAEAGNGHITKSMAQEAYQKLGSEVGKGEESIAKAFEALGKKLPKEIPSLKRAGLLGAVVALGLYCFNN